MPPLRRSNGWTRWEGQGSGRQKLMKIYLAVSKMELAVTHGQNSIFHSFIHSFIHHGQNFFYDHFFQFYSPPLLKFLNVPNFILFKQQRHKVFVPYINKFNINKQYMNLNQSWLIAGNTLLMANVTSIKINKTLECMFINTSEGLH